MSLLQMSLSGGAMILVIACLRALTMYRLPKRALAWLWSLPLIRLLVPFSIPAAFSIYSLLQKRTEPVPVANALPAPTRLPDLLPGKNAAVPVAGGAPSLDPATVVWLSGMLICAVFFLSAYGKFRRRLRESLLVSNDFAQAWLRDHPLRRTVSIRCSDRISAPMTYGVLRPVILMPNTTDWSDCKMLDYVLTHELVHICRFDALRKWVFTAALCIHWFNPLVWLMYFLANRDMELVCDEAVLLRLGGSAGEEYALTLIRMEERKGTLTGVHFSKNSMEERIRAIMKRKKISLAVLLAALILAGGATAFFSTSAKAENPSRASSSDYVAEKWEDAILIRDGSIGAASYSTDNGNTWKTLTPEEYERLSGASGVEWWTAEEYAAWLENEKKNLQDSIGSRGWTPSTGWFTWTQEMVDETIAEYEEVLAMIQNGYLVSKTVDGDENTMLVMNPLDRILGSGDGSYTVEKEGQKYDSNFKNVDYESLFADYKRCGLVFDNDEGSLYWNGRRVRIFIDGLEHEGGFISQYEHYDLEGEIDLRTVREQADNGDGSTDLMGPLVKLEEFEPDLAFLAALESQPYIDEEYQDDADQTAGELERYVQLGLTYETDAFTGQLKMSWNGKPVRSLFDPERQIWVCNSLGTSGVDLEAVYQNGRLTGLQIAENQDRAFVETGTMKNAEATAAYGSGNASGETLSRRMEKYAPYGVTYEERGGKRIIQYRGRTVEGLSDIQPDGSVFSLRSTDGGELNLTAVYDRNGTLSGVEIVKN